MQELRQEITEYLKAEKDNLYCCCLIMMIQNIDAGYSFDKVQNQLNAYKKLKGIKYDC